MNSLGNKQVMADNIKRLMNEFNVSRSDICTRLKLKPSTFSDWVNAKTYPRIDKGDEATVKKVRFRDNGSSLSPLTAMHMSHIFTARKTSSGYR